MALKTFDHGIRTNQIARDISSGILTDLATRHYICKFRIAQISSNLYKMKAQYEDENQFLFYSKDARYRLATLENLEKNLRQEIFKQLRIIYPGDKY